MTKKQKYILLVAAFMAAGVGFLVGASGWPKRAPSSRPPQAITVNLTGALTDFWLQSTLPD